MFAGIGLNMACIGVVGRDATWKTDRTMLTKRILIKPKKQGCDKQEDSCTHYSEETLPQTLQAEAGKKIAAIQRAGLYLERQTK